MRIKHIKKLLIGACIILIIYYLTISIVTKKNINPIISRTSTSAYTIAQAIASFMIENPKVRLFPINEKFEINENIYNILAGNYTNSLGQLSHVYIDFDKNDKTDFWNNLYIAEISVNFNTNMLISVWSKGPNNINDERMPDDICSSCQIVIPDAYKNNK